MYSFLTEKYPGLSFDKKERADRDLNQKSQNLSLNPTQPESKMGSE